jgi:uncharacterized protein YnzC (UPF0291/DUF896 family)
MGRDLLAEDYILKQLTSSLIYPEDELGKKFWDKIYKEAYDKYGLTNIPIDTFNKVWILPDKAEVYENGDVAFVTGSHLKVMLQEDYEALKKGGEENPISDEHKLASDVIREIILPAIEKEVNEGEHFAKLRQIYNSMILATWFKRNLEKNILGEIYAGKNKVEGVDIADKSEKEKIYQRYLEAFKAGAYNYVKDEYDPNTQEIIPRKYFSGGMEMNVDKALTVKNDRNSPGSGKSFIQQYKYLIGAGIVVGVLLTAKFLHNEPAAPLKVPPAVAVTDQTSLSPEQQEGKYSVGDLVKVEVTDAMDYDLVGGIIGASDRTN